MADGRILHKKGSHGERVIALNHLEFRVWVQYVLSADDYGVMRDSASVLRADNPRLEREPMRKVQEAMAALERSGLVQTFTHQGVPFWWQNDWQDFQQIRHPRATVNPAPSPELIATATKKQRELFGKRDAIQWGESGDIPETPQQDLRKVSETDPTLAGAGGRETHTLTPALTPALPKSAEESARETQPLIDGRAMRLHGQHAWCSLPRDGLCVPRFLHDEFVGKRGGPPFEGEVFAWYPRVLARYEGVAVGDKPIEFWRNEFAAWIGTVTSAPSERSTRTERTMSAAQRVIQAQIGSGKKHG